MVNSDTQNDIPNSKTGPTARPSLEDWKAQREALIAAAEKEAAEASQAEASTEDVEEDEDESQPAEAAEVATFEDGEEVALEGAEEEGEEQVETQPIRPTTEPESEDGRAKKVRYRPKDEVEALALKLQHEEGNEFLKLPELLKLAEQRLKGQVESAPEAPQAKQKPAKEEEDQPYVSPEELARTAAELYEQADKLEAEADQHQLDFETELAVEKRAKVREMRRQARTAENAIPEVQQREQEAIEAFHRSEDAVIAAFPEAADKNSRFNKRYLEIGNAWKEAGDDRVYRTDAPEIIAAIVAKELGISSKTKQQPKKAKTAATSAGLQAPVPASQLTTQPRRKAAPAPAPGGATRGNRSPSAPDMSSIKTIDQWEAYKKSLGLRGGF